MPLPILAALLWLFLANVIALLPSRDHHWTNAYILIAVGLPIALWLGWAQGWLWALAFVVAAASVLRWPVIYLWRWLRARLGRPGRGAGG